MNTIARFFLTTIVIAVFSSSSFAQNQPLDWADFNSENTSEATISNPKGTLSLKIDPAVSTVKLSPSSDIANNIDCDTVNGKIYFKIGEYLSDKSETPEFEFTIMFTKNGTEHSAKLKVYNKTAAPTSTGQPIAFYDAQLLSKASVLRKEKVYEILSGYCGRKIDDSNFPDLIKSNKFFSGIIVSEGNNPDMPPDSKSRVTGSSAGGGILGTDVTALADGLAQFMVARAKEELNIAFFVRFKETLEDPRFLELRMLFPETFQSLQNIDQNIYLLNNYLQTLREAMQHDLAQIIEHAFEVIGQDKFRPFFEQNPELDVVVRVGLRTADALRNHMHPGDLVKSLARTDFSPSDFSRNFSSAMKTLNLFSQSLRSDTTGSYWVNSFEIYNGLLNKDDVFKIYLGLLLEQARQEDITFYSGDKKYVLSSFFEQLKPDDYIGIKRYISSLTEKTGQLDKLTKEMKRDPGKADFDDYYRFFNTSLDLISAAFEVSSWPDGNIRKKITELKVPASRCISVARQSSYIALNVKSREYASAVMNLATLLDTIFSSKTNISRINSILTEISDYIGKHPTLLKEGFKKSDFVDLLNDYLKKPTPENLDAVDHYTSDKSITEDPFMSAKFNEIKAMLVTAGMMNIIGQIIKYGTFAANITRAQSAEEVKSALESAALPVGSYRIKRQSSFNISLNGYVGLTGGFQFDSAGNSGVIGAWAPVGPAFSWGNLCRNGKNSASLSIFVPVIDIGALALFRLNDDSTEIKSSITLNQILAPGLFFSLGFPGMPISFSAGYQMAPLLQSLSTGQPVLNSKNWGRIMVSIAVDIPLFNLYSKPGRDIKTLKVNE